MEDLPFAAVQWSGGGRRFVGGLPTCEVTLNLPKWMGGISSCEFGALIGNCGQQVKVVGLRCGSKLESPTLTLRPMTA